MKVYEIYFSPTGGTKKVTDILAKAWNREIVEIDLSADDLNSEIVMEADALCIIGAPVFGGRTPEIAVHKLHRLKGNQARAVVVSVYGNRAYEDALRELKQTAEEAGFHCIAGISAIAEHSIVHEAAKGRPDAKDCAELHAFIDRIKTVLNGDGECRVPGNYPYKAYQVVPMFPIVSNSCIQCGLCAAKCPVHAIPAEHPQSTDSKRCISCMRCIAVCPVYARYLAPESLEHITKKLAAVCSDRKSNACFLQE